MAVRSIAVLGAGNGGCAAAADLGSRGFEVRLYNRSRARLEPMIERGGLDRRGAAGEGFVELSLITDDLASAIRTANANTPVGTLEGERQTMTIQANRQLTNAADFAPIIVATLPGGGTVRLEDVATVEDSVENIKAASWSDGAHRWARPWVPVA